MRNSNPGVARDSVADLVDDRLHVGRRRALAGLDEVGVLVGDERAADPEATKTDPIDQFTR